MTTPPDNLSLPDRLRLAGFELILQGCPSWLYGAVYEAAEILVDTGRGETNAAPRQQNVGFLQQNWTEEYS